MKATIFLVNALLKLYLGQDHTHRQRALPKPLNNTSAINKPRVAGTLNLRSCGMM
jgi:hypothetical protein